MAIQIPPLSSVCDSNLSLSLTHESEIDISQSSLVPWENQESGCENGLCWEAQGAQSWVAQSLRTLTLLPRGWLFLISEDRKHVVLIHTHTRTHTRAHTHRCTHMCTNAPRPAQTRAPTQTHRKTHLNRYAHMQTHRCRYTHTWTCTHTHAHTRMCGWAHTHTPMHTWMCAHAPTRTCTYPSA